MVMYRVFLVITIACSLAGVLWYFFILGYDIKNYPPQNETIVAYGDSLVSGVGSDTGGFVSLLSQKLGVPIINLGMPGDTTASGYARIETVKAKQPGIVVVLLGGNDALRKVPIEDTFLNLEKIITELQKDGAVIVLLGVRGGLLSDPYEKKYKELAERTGSAYVPNILKGLITRQEYMADALHPNDKGYAIIADSVYETLEPLVSGK